MIGNPYAQAITSFDDLRVTTTLGNCSIGSAGCTLDEATLPAPPPATGGENVLGNVIFRYDASIPDYVALTSGTSLTPWEGYWVFELPAATDNNPVVRFPDLQTP